MLAAQEVNLSLISSVCSSVRFSVSFLAVMSSSSSDNGTQSVRSFVRSFVRPWPFFYFKYKSLVDHAKVQSAKSCLLEHARHTSKS